jgi:putative DNA primase/helicase
MISMTVKSLKNWPVYHEFHPHRPFPAGVVLAMKILYENIPAELTRLDRWVVWLYEERNGKLTKPPYVPAPGKKRHALVNVSSTWGTFEQAKKAINDGGFDGIGFVLGQGIFGIDFDHATDEMVKEALSLGSYTEWSPSGHGVHVIGRSGLVLKGRKKGSVELYMQGRYFTVTGSVVPGSLPDIREIPTDRMMEFFRRHFEEEPEPYRKDDTG